LRFKISTTLSSDKQQGEKARIETIGEESKTKVDAKQLEADKNVPSDKRAGVKEVSLFSYKGPCKMSPPPVLDSEGNVLKVVKVELIGEAGKESTKVTFSSWYGKIDTKSLRYRQEHETQLISILIPGDQTSKVKEGDLLRYCFYPN